MKKFLSRLIELRRKKWFNIMIVILLTVLLTVSFLSLIVNILYPAVSLDSGLEAVYDNWFILVGVFMPSIYLMHKIIKKTKGEATK